MPAPFTGIVYGLYLTFSTWLLYFITTKTQFFSGSIKMHNLNDQASRLLLGMVVPGSEGPPGWWPPLHWQLLCIKLKLRTPYLGAAAGRGVIQHRSSLDPHHRTVPGS